MAAYRRLAEGFRSDRVRAGLEVELCADGSLLLAPEDADGWDLLVGAIHEIPEVQKGVTSQTDTEAFFLRDVQHLLTHPIDVLAHPFRFFARKGLQKPVHLDPVVADLLAVHGVAAEINFHTNQPEPEFFRLCLARGVKIFCRAATMCSLRWSMPSEEICTTSTSSYLSTMRPLRKSLSALTTRNEVALGRCFLRTASAARMRSSKKASFGRMRSGSSRRTQILDREL